MPTSLIGPTDEATVIISDDDVSLANITAIDAVAGEPGNHGQFRVSLSNVSASDTTFSYSIGGSATAGIDYTTLSGSVTIDAGDSTALIDVGVLDDDVLENDETVIVMLAGITAGEAEITIDSSADSDVVTITDEDTATVSITANDASASEPSDNGQFRVSMTQASDKAVTVNYMVTGTADGGGDYVTLAGSVTIAAGELSTTIDVSVIDDVVLEDSETVIVTLTGTSDTDVSIDSGAGANTATVTISDEDRATATIIASDERAGEPSNPGQFTVSIDKSSDKDTTITYLVTGDATADTDYVALPGTVTIAAGQTSATIDVTVIDQTLLEDNETVIVQMISTSDGDVSIGAANTATVTIADDDTATVTITANDANAGEPTDPGQFTVTLSQASDKATVVNYLVTGDAIAGTDYVAIPASLTIAAGETTATIDVTVIDEALLEDNEMVIVTLTNTSDGDISVVGGSATVLISDDDKAKVSVTASDADASEPGDNGEFTVSISEASDKDTLVRYTVTGTADAGVDYTTLTGNVTILSGQTSAKINIAAIDDDVLEESETFILTLNSTDDPDISVDAAANTAIVTIDDDDIAQVSIAANDPLASEPGSDGQFTITLSAAADQATVVDYSVTGTANGGDDFVTLSGTVTIAAGETTATIDVDVIDDAVLENNETVVVTLDSVSGDSEMSIDTANNAALVNIGDDDSATVSVSANASTAGEPSNNGQFTISLSQASDANTDITYMVTGTAGAGADYNTLTGTVTILAGETSATIDVTVIDDNILEDPETVVVTIIGTSDGDVTINTGANSATVTIDDEDTALLSISASDAFAGEPSDNGEFTLQLSNASDRDTIVNLAITGTATVGFDYIALPTSVTILAGQTSAKLDVTVIDSALLEEIETVVATITGIASSDPDVTIDTGANSAAVNIADNGSATVSISANDSVAGEPLDHGQFTVTLSEAADRDTVISYLVAGTADAIDDFVLLPGSVTIAAGQTSAAINITVVDDTILEDSETVTLTLDTISAGDSEITIDASAKTATVNVSDEDKATVAISASDSSASEPSNSGLFTITMSTESDKDTVVHYLVSGNAGFGTDYVAIPSSVTIAAGTTEATINVAAIDDLILEDNETVIVTLLGTDDLDATIDGSAPAATVVIADDDTATASIVANDASVSEPSDSGQFTVKLTNASDKDTIINYSVTGTAGPGTDYVMLPASVTITAGATEATIDVNVLDQALLEDSETVIVTLTGTSDTNVGIAPAGNTATVTIADDDKAIVSIAATDTNSRVNPTMMDSSRLR